MDPAFQLLQEDMLQDYAKYTSGALLGTKTSSQLV